MANELILVIDDEPDILGLCERILSRKGYTVYTASSGSQATTIARETPFEIVLIDIQMPGHDGITVFETIKSYQPDIIGIVLSGYPTMEAALDAMKRGIYGFVHKPFTPDELREAVSDALARRRLERDTARLQALIPLYEVSRSLMTTIDIDVLLDQVVEVAVQETGADRASLMLERDGKLYIEAARGLPIDIMHATATPVGEGIAGWVAQHGEPLLLVKNVSMFPELADALTREEVASAVCAPLALQDRVIGVLNLTNLGSTERSFNSSDRDLITVLAGQVAIAIENARLFRQQRALTEELQEQAEAQREFIKNAAQSLSGPLTTIMESVKQLCQAGSADLQPELARLLQATNELETHVDNLVKLRNLKADQ